MSMVGNQVKYSNSPVYTATGNGTTVNHTLTWTPGTVNALIVSLSGVIQRPTTDYTVSGTTLTFTSAPPLNVPILVVGLDVAGTIGVPGDGTVTTAKLSEPLTLTSPDINGGTLDNAPVGATIPSTGAFTVLTESTGAAWTAYTPTISADTGTWGALTVTLARYRILGKTLFVSFYLTCSVSSGAPTQARILLPASKSGGYAGIVGMAMAANNGASSVPCWVVNSTSTYVAFQVLSGTFAGSCAFIGTLTLELA